jgi:ABC-type Fe3+ transport system permease subunit
VPRISWSKLLTALPAAAIIFICSALPLGWMLLVVIANPAVRHELSLTAFRAALLGRTLGYNAAAAVIATLMGLPAAFVLGRGRGLLAKVLWVILPAALLMPSLAYAYGWSQVVRIIRPWMHPLGISFEPTSPADVFRCIWSLAAWLWAVPAGLVGLALRRLDTAVQQQALLDGALRRVTFRQLAGPIVASLAIVTVLATQEFAVYEPTGISVIATEVRMVFDTGALGSPDNSIAAPGYTGAGARSPDQPARAAAAVATAAPLIGVTLLLAIVAAWGAASTSATDALTAGADWPPALNASRKAIVATIFLLALNVGVPVAALIGSLRSFSIPRMYGEFGPQLGGTMLVATEASLVAIALALSAAGQWVPGALAIAGASFLIGGQLLAIALIRIMNRPTLGLEGWAYDTSVAVVIAYVGRFGWLAVAAGRSTWSRPWRELRDVAAVDGATTARTARSVVWPLAWPTLLAGGLLVGALCLTEVPATVLLMPQNPQVLTPALMTWVHMSRYDPMIEASLLMMAAVLIPALAAVSLTALGLRLRRGWQVGRTS